MYICVHVSSSIMYMSPVTISIYAMDLLQSYIKVKLKMEEDIGVGYQFKGIQTR